MVISALVLVAMIAQPDPAALAPLYRQALEAREKQFGPEHPKTARSASDLGLYLRKLGDRERAAILLRRALAIDLKSLGETHAVVAEDRENLATVVEPDEAAALYRATHNFAKLAELHEARGDRKAAIDAYRRELAKQESAVVMNDLALLLEPAAAEPLLRRALAIQNKSLGADHPETASTMNNLANVLLATGRLTLAEQTQRRALRVLEDALGSGHPRVAVSCSNLADILRARRDFVGAERYYRRALAIDEKAYGPDHPEVAADRRNLEELLKLKR